MQNLYHRNRRWRSSKVVPKGMQSLCVQVWACGCVSSALASFFASYHHIISHNITSYIILHQWHKNRIRSRSSANASSKWKCAKARSKLREIQLHQPCHKRRDPSLRSMNIFTKHDLFLYEAWKEGKVFFRRRLKNGMYVKFHASQRSEFQIIYILDSNIYTSNITVLLQ